MSIYDRWDAVVAKAKALTAGAGKDRSGFEADFGGPSAVDAEGPQVLAALKAFPNGEAQAGVHVHTLEREANTTKLDGMHRHVFVLPDDVTLEVEGDDGGTVELPGGAVLTTQEDGPHKHTLNEHTDALERQRELTLDDDEPSRHRHIIVLAEGIELITQDSGMHAHELQAEHTAFDGTHAHNLVLGETTLTSLTGAQLWDEAGQPPQADLPPSPAASALAASALAEAPEPTEAAASPIHLANALSALAGAVAGNRLITESDLAALVPLGKQEDHVHDLPTGGITGPARLGAAHWHSLPDGGRTGGPVLRGNVHVHALVNGQHTGTPRNVTEAAKATNIDALGQRVPQSAGCSRCTHSRERPCRHGKLHKRAHRVRLLKADTDSEGQIEERYVFGVVLVPDEPDAQGDVYDAKEVEKAAHSFLEHFGSRMKLMHQGAPVQGVVVVESYLSKAEEVHGGETFPVGTWFLATRVQDDDVWAAVKSGAFTGFSMGGTALREALGPDSN